LIVELEIFLFAFRTKFSCREGMFSARKRKEQAPRKELLSQKKSKPPDEPNFITIRLDEKTLTALCLKVKNILTISDSKYLANITDRLSYIYDIVSRVCNCPIEAVTLYRQADGELRDENTAGWRPVDQNSTLKGGFYLCKCNEGPIPSITHFDWLRILQKART
jgi:hypothetical protein